MPKHHHATRSQTKCQGWPPFPAFVLRKQQSKQREPSIQPRATNIRGCTVAKTKPIWSPRHPILANLRSARQPSEATFASSMNGGHSTCCASLNWRLDHAHKRLAPLNRTAWKRSWTWVMSIFVPTMRQIQWKRQSFMASPVRKVKSKRWRNIQTGDLNLGHFDKAPQRLDHIYGWRLWVLGILKFSLCCFPNSDRTSATWTTVRLLSS